MRIGILGGSFDPVHAGHLKLAEAAAETIGLDRVIFVPSSQNPLKKKASYLSASERYALLKRTLKGRRGFVLSDCELKRPGPSYTIDTVRFFKRKYGRSAMLYFLAGADTVPSLGRWRDFDKLKRLCRFVVCSRPGYPVNRLPAGVLFMPFDALPVSATEIRARLKKKGEMRSKPRKR